MEIQSPGQYGGRIMPRGSQRLKSVSFRIDPDLAEKLKAFLADHAGRPAYLTPHQFASEAIHRELERLSVLYGEGEGKSPVVRRINTVHVPEPRRTS